MRLLFLAYSVLQGMPFARHGRLGTRFDANAARTFADRQSGARRVCFRYTDHCVSTSLKAAAIAGSAMREASAMKVSSVGTVTPSTIVSA